MSEEMRRYTFKLYPNKAQETALREEARMCAMLWNGLLEMRETHYRRAKQAGEKKTSLTAFDQGKDITALRAELPEWRAQPRGTQERVAEMLDLAFKAFFRRAKGGAGASSGYPRFKSVVRADSVHLREPVKSCWTFSAHSGPARKGEPSACGEDGSISRVPRRARERGEEVRRDVQPKTPRARGGEGLGESERATRRSARPTEEAGSRNWRLRMRGLPGLIKAKGEFPAAPLSHKTADIRFEAGAWWFSICVGMEKRRRGGNENLRVEFDLIDEFARVTRADGPCGAAAPPDEGLVEAGIPSVDSGLSESPGANLLNEEEAQVDFACRTSAVAGANPANGGKCRSEKATTPAPSAHPTNEEGAQGSESIPGETSQVYLGEEIDAIKSARDRRFKRGSIRWRREKLRAAKLSARQARRRREWLHKWTTGIVGRAAGLTVISTPVTETRTGHGTVANPGAEVGTIAALNRRVRSLAPGAAVQMLKYKSSEAGIACEEIVRQDHEIRVGTDLKAAARTHRRAKRAVKRKEKVYV